MTLRKLEHANEDSLIKRAEELKDLFTPNGKNWDALTELLEIERELTLREGYTWL
jgi:hypothetical protein